MSDQKRWTFFLSHVQRETATEAVQLAHALGTEICWLDRMVDDRSVDGMRRGVHRSSVFLCILSEGYFDSQYCMSELAWALAERKPIVTVFPCGTDVGALLRKAPESHPLDGEALEVRKRLQSVDAIKIDAKDDAYFKLGVLKIQQRTGQFRAPVDSVASAAAAARTLRSRAVMAAEAVGHKHEGKHLRKIVDELAASLIGSQIDMGAPVAHKLDRVERELTA